MHCVERARAVGCDPVVVVWGAAPLPDTLGVRLCHNPGWPQGPLSSLQVGLAAVVGPEVSGVLVLTVDRPHVRETTLRSMAQAHLEAPNSVVQPRFGPRRGHPVLHPRVTIDALAALSPTDTPRTVMGRADVRGARVLVDVDDPAVVENLDTPDTLALLADR